MLQTLDLKVERYPRQAALASGPIPLLLATNEIGRNVMQGGSSRSVLCMVA